MSSAATTAATDTLLTQIGLANLGNTCFLNSVLQALRLSWPLAETFLPYHTLHQRAGSKKAQLLEAFQTLLRDFWRIVPAAGTRPTLVPRGFFHQLHTVLRDTEDDWYRPGQQCDAAEALQYILESLHDAMYRQVRMEIVGATTTAEETSQQRAIQSWIGFFKKEYSDIVKHFYGQSQIKIQCDRCKNVSERYEPWLMLKVPLPGAGATMTDALQAAFADEVLEDYHCDRCASKGSATIRTRIARMPPITLLTIKRFSNSGAKLRGKLVWDLDALDFAPFQAFSRDPIGDSRTAPVYETYAVIEHNGLANGGHYRMYGRQASTWYEYDDTLVRAVHPDAVVNDDSYIVFLMPRETAAARREAFSKIVGDFRIAYKELHGE